MVPRTIKRIIFVCRGTPFGTFVIGGGRGEYLKGEVMKSVGIPAQGGNSSIHSPLLSHR